MIAPKQIPRFQFEEKSRIVAELEKAYRTFINQTTNSMEAILLLENLVCSKLKKCRSEDSRNELNIILEDILRHRRTYLWERRMGYPPRLDPNEYSLVEIRLALHGLDHATQQKFLGVTFHEFRTAVNPRHPRYLDAINELQEESRKILRNHRIRELALNPIPKEIDPEEEIFEVHRHLFIVSLSGLFLWTKPTTDKLYLVIGHWINKLEGLDPNSNPKLSPMPLDILKDILKGDPTAGLIQAAEESINRDGIKRLGIEQTILALQDWQNDIGTTPGKADMQNYRIDIELEDNRPVKPEAIQIVLKLLKHQFGRNDFERLRRWLQFGQHPVGKLLFKGNAVILLDVFRTLFSNNLMIATEKKALEKLICEHFEYLKDNQASPISEHYAEKLISGTKAGPISPLVKDLQFQLKEKGLNR